jgi:hypothetical protein
MAFPTDTFTGVAGDLDVMIPAVWGQKVNDFYRAKLKIAQFFVNRSDELSEGGNIVYTPNLTEMTANAKTNATAVTLNSPTETRQTLTVNNWFEVSFVIEDREAAFVKRSYNVQQRYMKNAAFTVAKKLEDAVATLFNGFSVSVGTTTVALTEANVRLAISKLEGTNLADFEESAWFFHPKTIWVDIMAIDRFALAFNSPGMNPVQAGAVGRLYGRPVFSSTRVQKINTNADYAGALAVPDSIHWATAPLPGQRDPMGVRMQANYIPEYLGTMVTCDILYGVIENRDAGGVLIVSAV